MADHWLITVEDHNLGRALGFVAANGLVKATRKGISNHIRFAQGVARAQAPFAGGSIYRRSLTRDGLPSGRVGIGDFRLRLWASGTKLRHTRKGYNRGFILADPIIDRTASATDPLVERHIDQAVNDALREAGVV